MKLPRMFPRYLGLLFQHTSKESTSFRTRCSHLLFQVAMHKLLGRACIREQMIAYVQLAVYSLYIGDGVPLSRRHTRSFNVVSREHLLGDRTRTPLPTYSDFWVRASDLGEYRPATYSQHEIM